ncbi:MAG: thiamine pyrophosphate-binding protein [Burkholderiales bacterium]|nr:thiamine pyrophosphate-binding protein [Burkholderiales bacterium]
MKMSGGKAAVEALRAVGVDTLFGLMGSSTLDMYDALYDAKDIKHIGVRDERAGAHMADAYGRISGKPGVIIAGQSGPGSTNLVTGLAQAKLAYSPVLAITGLPMTQHVGKDSFQEIDQHTLFLPVTKRSFTVPVAKRIPEFIFDAMRIASTGRKGPVLLNIARDLFSAQIDYEGPKRVNETHYAGQVPESVIKEVRKLLENAKSPAIIVGGGVKWSRGHEEVLKLAEALQLPMVASSGHGDVIPNDHPLYFGYAGPEPYGNPVARALIQNADVILALGTRLGFSTTMYGNEVIAKDTKIIQVELDPGAIGNYYPVQLGIVGDAKQFSACLSESADRNKPTKCNWTDRNIRFQALWNELWREREITHTQTRKPLSPERAFSELRSVMPKDTIVALDSGTLCRQAADLLRYYKSPALLTPLDFALVGFGYAAGIGAKVAAPERPVISLAGDGGFGMSVMEICTSVQSGINTVGIVLDNECWGAEKAYQRDFYNERYIADKIISPRYDVVAKSCGAEGYFVTEPGELADAVAKGLKAEKPVVIHVKIDPDAIVSSRKDALKHRLHN